LAPPEVPGQDKSPVAGSSVKNELLEDAHVELRGVLLLKQRKRRRGHRLKKNTTPRHTQKIVLTQQNKPQKRNSTNFVPKPGYYNIYMNGRVTYHIPEIDEANRQE
jgi:hypothetical protein